MTDEYSAGAPSPDPVSIPDSPASEHFGHPVDVASDPEITEKRHAVLGELAKI